MAITIDDLTVNFDHIDSGTLLEDWEWLIGLTKRPILLTAVGDAFVKDTQNGSIHLLAVERGDVTPIASDLAEFKTLLTDQEFVMDYFAVEAVVALQTAGVTLKPGQIYSLTIPAVLGGKHTLDNVKPIDISIHFSIKGQIHRQVKDLPPGTKIDGFTTE